MKKQRNTKQRQMVLDAVKDRCDHPTADQIYLDVREKDDKISRGTVYRNLNTLVEQDEILRVKMPVADRFEGQLVKHYHLICSECGEIYDIPLEYDIDMDKELQETTGHDIKRHRMIFEGVCANCRNKNK